MNQLKTSLIVASLALASCSREEPKPARPPEAPTPDLQQASFPTLTIDQRALPALQNFPQTVQTIFSISQSQNKSFKETGDWVTNEGLAVYEQTLIKALSQDLLNLSLIADSSDGLSSVIKQLNKAGYHLYPSLMNIEDRPYFNIVLFQLGEVKNSPELEVLKDRIGVGERNKIGMRELIEAYATELSESLYGAPSGDGNVLVNVHAILNDQDNDVRDMRSLFNAVLINELAHIKLQQAEASGRQKQLDMEVAEAYSDYWTIVINPKEEICFAIKDILVSTTIRYEESKQYAVQGIEKFCRAKIPNFTKLEDHFSEFELLIQDPKNHNFFKNCIVEAYQKKLVEAGILSELL